MHAHELKTNVTVYGPLFPEPVQVIIAVPMGSGIKLVGKGARSNTVYEPILSADQLALLTASPASEPFDGDANKPPPAPGADSPLGNGSLRAVPPRHLGGIGTCANFGVTK